MLRIVSVPSRLAPMTGPMLRAIRLSAIAAVLFAGAASAQENERGGLGFLEQLFGGSERVAPSTGQDRAPAATPDRVPGGGQIGPGGPGGQNRVAQSGSELMMRIDRLEAQIRQLTGAVEQLQYRNQQLEGQLRSMQPGSEYRIQDGGAAPRSAPATRPAGTPPPAAQPPAATPGRRGDAFDPSLNPNAPGAPRTMGSLPGSVAQSQVYDPDDPVGAPGGRAAGAPLDLSTLAGAPPADASLSAGMAARRTPTTSPMAISCAATTRSPKTASAPSCAAIRATGSPPTRSTGWARACFSASATATPRKRTSTFRPNTRPRRARLTRCSASARRSPPWARRRRPAPRSARSRANILARRSA